MAAQRARRAFRTRLRVPEGRDPALFWKSINRLAAAHAVAQWRARNGEVPASVTGYVEVIADALRTTDGGGRRYAFDVLTIRSEWLPLEWRGAITEDQIYTVVLGVERTRPPDEIANNREVGRLLGLHLTEVETMRAAGTNVPFAPVDISAAEHEVMRLEHKRAGSRERSRRYRETKKVANGRHAFPERGGVTEAATFSSQADAVRAAVEAGAVTVADVVAATGLPAATAKPILSRLVKSDAINRTGWGRYAAVLHAQADGAGRDAAAGTVHSGPETRHEPHEPHSEVRSAMPVPARVESTGRAPDARVTVGARRPHTLAGPDGVISLALAAPLHPRRAAPSRLPGTIFAAINRSIAHAAPSARRA